MATQSGTYDFGPVADAAGKANNYITDLGDSGIRVHPLDDADDYSAIDADGMSVVKGGTSVAHFGETARIGVENAFNTLIQSAQFAIRYAADRLFNVSTDGQSVDIYMGGSTAASGTSYTDAKVEAVVAYLNGGCTVDGTAVLDPQGDATGYTLDANDFVLDSSGHMFESGSYQGIYYGSTSRVFGTEPKLTPQGEIPGAPVSIAMGNVGVSAANKRLVVKANNLIIQASHISEGDGTNEPSGSYSHCEGSYTKATKQFAHAEGIGTTASGSQSHAEGIGTTASGSQSHAEGMGTTASGVNSHAQNLGTVAAYANQTAIGKWNDSQSSNAFEVGNGTSDTARSNAFSVGWDGTVTAAGEVTGASTELNVSLASGVTADAHAVRRSGKMATVYVVGLNLATELANHGSATVGTVPEGARPPYAVYGQLAGWNDGGSYVSIAPGGAVTVSNQSGAAIPTARELGFTVSYVM